MYIPRKGDTVLVHHKSCHNNGETVVAAIVTQVFNEYDTGNPTMCNLIAFPPFMAPQHLGSVTFHETEQMIESVDYVGCWPKLNGHHHLGETPIND